MISKSQIPDIINFKEGEVILIDKDYHLTSFDIIRIIKKKLNFKEKIGHAGTLDPLASGLVILCTGKKTKQIDSFQNLPKTYEGVFEIGAQTPSFDLESEITTRSPFSHITEEDVKAAAGKLTGEIMQLPPQFSAVKVEGKRLYESARKGKQVEVQPRKVTISTFEVKYKAPFIHFKIECSKGTYIRSIAHDIGELLGTGAYLFSLRRTAIGSYKAEDALEVEDFVNLINEKLRE